MKVLKQIITLILIFASSILVQAQEPTMEQTLSYLNANITDLKADKWSEWNKITYEKEGNVIKLFFEDDDGTVDIVFHINMNKEYTIVEKEDVQVTFKNKSIICVYEKEGGKYTRNEFEFSNIEPKTVRAMKHLLKLAYANRDTTFDNVKF